MWASSIQVPADGLLVQGYSLSINESAMTGESDLVSDSATLDMHLVAHTPCVYG